jgi:molybdopterin-guanine dinucleotide biosynthesis protein A
MLSLAILAGGPSSRMGQDKALMPLLGRPLIQRVLERLSRIADEVILSTNAPAEYAFLKIRTLPDMKAGQGALGGLYTILEAAKYPHVAAVACDMPFASPALFEYELELSLKNEADVVIPSTAEGLEPLHAIYRRETCLPIIRAALEAKSYKMTGWLHEANVRVVPPEVTVQFDPKGLAFKNLNTPEEFAQAEELTRVEEE